MFAEVLDRATHRAAVEAGYAPLDEYVERFRLLTDPFPNLRARETVKAVVEGIVDTINHCPSLTTVHQQAFALGFLRGAITVLRAECEEVDVQYSALPILLAILDKFNQEGISAVREIAELVTGQELRAAEQDQLARDMLPDLTTFKQNPIG